MKRDMNDMERQIFETELQARKLVIMEQGKLTRRVKANCIKDKAELMKLQLEYYENHKYAILPSEFLTVLQVIECFKKGIKDYKEEWEFNRNQ